MIYIIAFSFVGLCLIVYLSYMYSCYAEEIRIKRLEDDYELHTDYQFYLTVFKLMTTYELLTRFEGIDTMMEDARKLYSESADFRRICYKNGIKTRIEKQCKF